MDETLEILPGEGETKTITKIRKRQFCDCCGSPAHYKHTFLLPDARINRQSKAFGRDDCSWCEDERMFSCGNSECEKETKHMEGHEWCSTFPASERFAHMFLYWREELINEDL